MKKLTFLIAIFASIALSASSLAQTKWSINIQTAPKLPQDVWVTGMGSNSTDWRSGGNICLGRLAQGIPDDQHAILLTKFTSAGVFGVDGAPVAPGNYIAPGGTDYPDRPFSMIVGRSFYVILDTRVIESNIPWLPVGSSFPLMFTFETRLGYAVQELAAWTKDGAGNWFPFLNEGPMMTNLLPLR